MNTFSESTRRAWPDNRAVWRWHFYAGLFCIPFVLILSLSGAVYLFKEEIESWLDRPYDGLTIAGAPASAESRVHAALNAVPGSSLQAYELPRHANDAARVIINQAGEAKRVYLHPETLQILNVVPEEDRPMRFLFKLHGELLMGNVGSALVELAASWTIIMVLTGLYLWWPGNTRRLEGVVYPRIGKGSRIFWRDIHGVTGFWISGMVLFLLLSGLPWAKFWGDYLKRVRRITGTAVARQDWTNGATPRVAADDPVSPGEHEGHGGRRRRTNVGPPAELSSLDRIVATVERLDLPPPVLIAPPGAKSFGGSSPEWTAKSMTANRTKRVDLVMDPKTGAIKSRKDFKDRHLVDRVVGTGVAAHEGRLFGWPNQLLGVITAGGLVLVSLSSIVMWWTRRRPGELGAPRAGARPLLARGFLLLVLGLAVYLPLFGLSLFLVWATERVVLTRIPGVRAWLGLTIRPS